MSKQDFIYCEKGALSKETCNKLINFFDKNINMGSPGIMGNMGYLDNLEITLDTGNSGTRYVSFPTTCSWRPPVIVAIIGVPQDRDSNVARPKPSASEILIVKSEALYMSASLA